VGKCTSYQCQIFSGFHTPKIIKIGYFLTELLGKKGGRFFETQCRLTETGWNQDRAGPDDSRTAACGNGRSENGKFVSCNTLTGMHPPE